jgi:hypothetical protein
MITVTCPWCEGDISIEADERDLACDQCAVRVEFAPDPAAGLDLAA